MAYRRRERISPVFALALFPGILVTVSIWEFFTKDVNQIVPIFIVGTIQLLPCLVFAILGLRVALPKKR